MSFKHTLVLSLAVNLLFLLITIGVVSLAILSYRGPLFEHFASQYLEGIDEDLVGDEIDTSFTRKDHETRVIEAVDSADPAVVSVLASRTEAPQRERDPFSVFFDPFYDPEQEDRVGGSGFIVSPDGYVVTNRHVVEREGLDYSILTNSGEQYDVEVLAQDPIFDIAVLEIHDETSDTPEFEYLTFTDPADLNVGQTAIAIGNALGEFQNSVSVGVVAGLSRSITAGGVGGGQEFFDEVIQTDAAINPGNSGGPLLNSDGEVIGVNVALVVGSQNIGFAIPAHLVEPIVSSVQETGRIQRAFLGVRYIEITPFLQAQEELPVDHGILLIEGDGHPAVMPDTPADEAGFQAGDIITEIDGEEIRQREQFAHTLRRKQVGESVELVVVRGDEEVTVEVTLRAAPEDV